MMGMMSASTINRLRESRPITWEKMSDSGRPERMTNATLISRKT